MTCEQLLDRIITLSQTIAEAPHLQALGQQPFEEQEVKPQQWQHCLQQDFKQRQRLSAELQTLTRQLRLYLNQSQLMASNEKSSGKTSHECGSPLNQRHFSSATPPSQSTLSSVFGNILIRKQLAELKELATVRQATEQERQRYQDLFEFAPDGYLTIDGEGFIQQGNYTATELLNVEASELVGQSLFTFVRDAEDKACLSQAIARAAQATTEIQRCELQLCCKHGTSFPAGIRLSWMRQNGDDGVYLRCLLQDLSEWKSVYQALANSEKKWKALFEQSVQLMALLDPQGKVLEINQTGRELLEQPLDEIQGKRFSELPWWDNQSISHQVPKWIQVATMGGVVQYEVRLVTAQGEAIPIDLSLKSVRDENNQVVLLIAEGRDLRDRARKEAQLRREKDISDSIIESLPGAFYMVQKNGPFVRWNQQLETFTGYTSEEIPNMDPLDLIVDSDRPYVHQKLQQVFHQGEVTGETTLLGKHHQTLNCYFSNVSFCLDDGQEYLIGVAIDITEQKRLQNERQKLASLVENSKELIGLTTLEGQIQFINPCGEELLGINPGKAEFPLLLQDCFSQTSENRFKQEILPSILEKEQWYGELELMNHRTGARVPVLANIFLIRDSLTGTPINLGVITRNISRRKEMELKLQASEKRFRSIFEQAAVGMALCEFSGSFKQVNQRVCNILGYQEQEILTRNYHDLMAPESKPAHEESVQKIIRGEITTFSQQQQYYRKDGNLVWIKLTLSLIRSDHWHDQQGSSLLLILEDISDRKAAEAALERSEQKYRSLVNGISEVIFQVDFDGNWRFLNPAWKAITGYSVEETIGTHFLDYAIPEDFQTHQSQFQRLIRKEISDSRYEVRFQTKDGGFCWLEITACITQNSQGQITGLTGTLNDMTERRQAEDQLLAVINTVPGLVSWVNRERQYLGVNQQLANTLGMTPEDMVDQPIGFFDGNSSLVQLIDQFLETPNRQTSQEIEITHPKTGDNRSFLIAGQKYRQGDAAVFIGIDISERKQAELALQESETKFRQLAENIQQVFWMVDLEQQAFIYISPAYESLWGYEIQSVYDCSTNFLKALHPDDYEEIVQAIPKQIRGQYNEQYRIIRPDGEIRWIHDRAFPVHNDQGEVYRIAGIAEDITERKRSQEALKKRERYLKALVGVQRRLLASRVDEQIYQEFLAILGDACEASRIYVYENWVDADGTLKAQKCAEWWPSEKAGETKIAKQETFSYQELGMDFYEQLKQGEFLQNTVDNLSQPIPSFFTQGQVLSFLMIPLMVNGEFFGIIGFDNCETTASWGRLEVGLLNSAAAAITLAKEKQLTQEQLQKQLTAIETTTDGIMILGVSGEFQYVNPAYCQMLGYSSPEHLIETPWQNYYGSDQIPRIQNEIFPQLQSHQEWNGEMITPRRDGTTFIQELSLNLTENGEIVGVCRDISQRKEAEEQLKASLEEKELLLKEVHHRVKNNLQVISSIFSLQSQSIEDENALAILEESQNRISSMSLVHEKLYQAANLSNIDFDDYIQDLTSNLLMTYNINPDRIQTEMNIESLQLNLDTAIPCGLLINELVSNALKHGFPEDRGGRIWIFLGVKDEPAETLCLKVEDNGIGLPEDFNPKKATSLGGSLISSLTKQLRGTLQFKNNPGASFEITFPKPVERKRF